ncbi:dynein light chain 1, axonemal-like [Cimex lectularius]|uniref:Dynein axonemal light chain 1 n=1 Tax=Cimex lectularius TaxID=79782 RepID=A0A8I6RGY8_CIMLE|nr:dynein light chain 1, axonemal-like [Cimex lectularius]
MSKTTTIREALKKWEEQNQTSAAEALEVDLQFQWLPIEKMDNNLSQLVKCEKLSLSTNMIEKISGLSGMKNLKILSLGRNYIKSFTGLECLGETLEQLWISYNLIDKMKGAGALKKLKVLNMNNNLIKDWAEFQKLQENLELKELSFIGNPLCEAVEEGMWRSEATRRLPQLDKLDGEPVICEINATL